MIVEPCVSDESAVMTLRDLVAADGQIRFGSSTNCGTNVPNCVSSSAGVCTYHSTVLRKFADSVCNFL